jgi:TonB-linked SusC/RagA family outer membrane protein
MIYTYIKNLAFAVLTVLLCGNNLFAQQDSVPVQDSIPMPAIYNDYAREAITGAVASVSGKELEKSPTNILSETMTGRLPGLVNMQNLSELTFFGYSSFTKYIRGISTTNGYDPLVIIDGVVTPTQYYEFISAKEIENITVLKDASATAIYGIQGAAGAIVINTKRGYETKKRIVEAYADFSLQEVTRRPLFVNSAQYAALRNEAGERDGLGAYSQFTQSQIDRFAAGNDPLYPSNNWYDMFIKKAAMRERAGVNVTGGSKKFRYFTNISFVNQEQPFITSDEPKENYAPINPTPRVNVVNFRSNMDVKFNDIVSGFMRLTGNVKREMQTGTYFGDAGSILIYSTLFEQPPTMYGPLSPTFASDEGGSPEDVTYLSNMVMTMDGLSAPVYGILNRSGYAQVYETNVIAQAGLNFNLDFITKGLNASGSMAYQTYSRNQLSTTQQYGLVYRDGLNNDNPADNNYSNENNFIRYQPETYNYTPLAYGDGHTFFYYLNLFGGLTYKRSFGQHSIDASAHTYYLMQEKETGLSGANALPYRRQTSGFSLLYGFAEKYYLKGDLGYSGSEQFSRENRWIFTPAVSAAYVVSKEKFFENDYVNLLKLRASYGITANDQFGDTRFLYLDNIDAYGYEKQLGNPDLTAEKVKKLNLGIDLGFLKMFSLNFDWFTNRTDNMLISSYWKVPVYQGYKLDYYAKLNEGVMTNKGYEIGIGFDKELNKDLRVFARFDFMNTRNKVLNINEQALADSDEDHPYAYPLRTEGYPLGQLWGLQVDYSNGNGMFNSQEEIDRYNLDYSALSGAPANGRGRLGDLIYKDLNNDGKINEKDVAPIGNPRLPEQQYSFSGGASWKNWELSFLFNGVNRTSFILSGTGVNENNYKYGYYSDMHLNAWTPERYAAGEEITYPALSLTTSVNHVNNDYFLQNGAYLRLKNLEIAYTLPSRISKKISSEKIRLMFNAQNLFTIDAMKTKYIDPEIRSMMFFSPFRVYNLGVSLNF